MKLRAEFSTAHERYDKAYAAHYSDRDLSHALQLYCKILTSFPSSPEAEHSQMQVRNIVNVVVPKQELLDASIDLALIHLGASRPLSIQHHATACSVAPLPLVNSLKPAVG